jgi:hypothetical protein
MKLVSIKLKKLLHSRVFLIGLAVVIFSVLALAYISTAREGYVGMESMFLKGVGLFSTDGEKVETSMFDTNVSPISTDPQEELSQETDQLTAGDLLPPSGEEDYLSNLLYSGFSHGVDSRIERNANLQIRSDPVVPRVENLSPFNQTTINSQDVLRKSLELGSI